MVLPLRTLQLAAVAAPMVLLAIPGVALGDGSSSGGSSGGGSSSSSGGACIDWASGSSGGSSSSSGSSGGSSSSGSSGSSSSSGSSGGSDDHQPPSAPGGVVVSAITSSSAKIAWAPSTDNVGVMSYEVHVLPTGGSEPELIAFTNGCTHEVTVSGLTPRTDYTFTVEAWDIGGNRTRSAPVGATTAAPAPFALSVEPSAISLHCRVGATATVHVTATPGFSGTADLSTRSVPADVRVQFSPATTASTSQVTFSCEPFPGFAVVLAEVVGSSGAQDATAAVKITVFGDADPSDGSSSGGSSGGSSGASSSSSGGTGSSSGSSSGGFSSSGGTGSSSGSSSGGSSSSSGSGSSGASSGSGSSSGGANDSGFEKKQLGCAAGGGGATAGLLMLPLLLWVARPPRRRRACSTWAP